MSLRLEESEAGAQSDTSAAQAPTDQATALSAPAEPVPAAPPATDELSAILELPRGQIGIALVDYFNRSGRPLQAGRGGEEVVVGGDVTARELAAIEQHRAELQSAVQHHFTPQGSIRVLGKVIDEPVAVPPKRELPAATTRLFCRGMNQRQAIDTVCRETRSVWPDAARVRAAREQFLEALGDELSEPAVGAGYSFHLLYIQKSDGTPVVVKNA